MPHCDLCGKGSNGRAFPEKDRPEKSLLRCFFYMPGRVADASGRETGLTHSAGDLGIPVGIGLIPLSLGQVFLARWGLKTNELPDTGKDV